MYTVGLDVDKHVFTKKILLYAGNSCTSSPLGEIPSYGTIYLSCFSGQSAGNFSFSTKVAAKREVATEYTLDNGFKVQILPLISDYLGKHKSHLCDEEFGYLLAGLIEGEGRFTKKELHINFSSKDISFAYYIKKRIGYGKVYQIKDKKSVGYICEHAKGLFYVLSLINGKFVSKYKYEELIQHNYHEDFKIEILRPVEKLSLDNY